MPLLRLSRILNIELQIPEYDYSYETMFDLRNTQYVTNLIFDIWWIEGSKLNSTQYEN